MNKDKLPYNPKDANSILEYASVLIGSTLREHVNIEKIDNPKIRKGSFGNAIEYAYFQYDLNSDSNPDFAEVGMELKTTPLKKIKNGQLRAKERLVIGMINYMDVVNEKFETSHFLEKSNDILLISYLYEEEKDPLDYEIVSVIRWGIPDEDLTVIKQDWETIVNKIKAGNAHEISGSDTLYLEACTKGRKATDRRKQPFSNEPAKPRAWALKNSYMTTIQNKFLDNFDNIKRDKTEAATPLLTLIKKRFKPYIGLTQAELAQKFGYINDKNKIPKNIGNLITKKILNVKEESKIEEFEKANIKTKTIRIKKNGKLKEAVSFPYFDYCKLAQTSFKDSNFYQYLQTKYLLIIYREDEFDSGIYKLSEITFWQMPDQDLDEAKKCYEEMQKRVNEGHAENSVKSTENRCCHVRPHGRNSDDKCMTPYGIPVVKKCFWLNQNYFSNEVEKATKKDS
ncbi:MAG: hypothetical protein MJ189_05875 [Coriobacteriales bacterium]|nr:hypothetical protein [Coriobacteriales bacterium]